MPVEGDKCGHILIDCGKHFRESIVRWGPRYGVTAIDAILLTNDLASAVLGLDDIRLVDGLRKDIPIIVGRRHFGHVVCESNRVGALMVVLRYLDFQVCVRTFIRPSCGACTRAEKMAHHAWDGIGS